MKEPKQDKNTGRKSSPGATISIIAIAFVVFMALFIYTGPLKRYHMSQTQLADLRLRVTELNDEKRLEEARLLSQETLTERLKERKPNFDLWAFMNATLAETKLKERANLENYKPRGDWRGAGKEATDDITMVQLKLEGVTLKDLVDFLHRIYASKNLVAAYKLEYLRPIGEDKGLECNIIFLTPKA